MSEVVRGATGLHACCLRLVPGGSPSVGPLCKIDVAISCNSRSATATGLCSGGDAAGTEYHRGHGTPWSKAALPSDNINSPTVEQSDVVSLCRSACVTNSRMPSRSAAVFFFFSALNILRIFFSVTMVSLDPGATANS